ETAEEVLLRAAEGLQFDEVLAAAEHAAEAHDQDIDQGVPQVLALPTRIGDRRQRGHQGRRFLGLHVLSSLRASSGSVCTDPGEPDQRKSLSGNGLKCASPARKICPRPRPCGAAATSNTSTARAAGNAVRAIVFSRASFTTWGTWFPADRVTSTLSTRNITAA